MTNNGTMFERLRMIERLLLLWILDSMLPSVMFPVFHRLNDNLKINKWTENREIRVIFRVPQIKDRFPYFSKDTHRFLASLVISVCVDGILLEIYLVIRDKKLIPNSHSNFTFIRNQSKELIRPFG